MKILNEQENVVLASTIFETKIKALKQNAHKRATSASYHENYY